MNPCCFPFLYGRPPWVPGHRVYVQPAFEVGELRVTCGRLGNYSSDLGCKKNGWSTYFPIPKVYTPPFQERMDFIRQTKIKRETPKIFQSALHKGGISGGGP